MFQQHGASLEFSPVVLPMRILAWKVYWNSSSHQISNGFRSNAKTAGKMVGSFTPDCWCHIQSLQERDLTKNGIFLSGLVLSNPQFPDSAEFKIAGTALWVINSFLPSNPFAIVQTFTARTQHGTYTELTHPHFIHIHGSNFYLYSLLHCGKNPRNDTSPITIILIILS